MNWQMAHDDSWDTFVARVDGVEFEIWLRTLQGWYVRIDGVDPSVAGPFTGCQEAGAWCQGFIAGKSV